MADLSILLSLPAEEKAKLFDSFIGSIQSYLEVGNALKAKPSSRRTESKPKQTGKYDYVEELKPEDVQCFERLKQWRNQVAKDLEWPSYMILDNKTLMAIAHYKPKNDEELLQIKGLGPEKLGRYSETILEILKEAPKDNKRRIPPRPSVEQPKKRFLGSNTLKYVSEDD